MADLLVELHSEEIPASLQPEAANHLQKQLTNGLVEAGLLYQEAQNYFTPRRLTLVLKGLTAETKERIEERKGPSVKAPQQAIDGFLRATGLKDINEAQIKTDPKKGDFYLAQIVHAPQKAEDILQTLLPQIINNFSWSKSMRWGAASKDPASLRWVRPLRSIICLLTDENNQSKVIDFQVSDINSSNVTYGHRFIGSKEAIYVNNFDEYISKLEKDYVILDANRRKDIIMNDAKNLCFAQQIKLVEDDNLLNEIAGLVEYPVVLLGEFDKEFLTIPSEVIRLTIKLNQKCFVTYQGTDSNQLSNHFIMVSNIATSDNGAEIIAGNCRVIRARLSDALYFWQKDQQPLPDLNNLVAAAEKLSLDISKPLDQRMAKLETLRVVFHASLGTLSERVLRIAKLTELISPLVNADKELAVRAAHLAKADLQTDIVGEFPELQGLIGSKYAKLQGEDDRICQAIENHYRPQGPKDFVPEESTSACLALADKLDLLCSFWLINEKPTGSRDPFALRRAALGTIRILLQQQKYINLLPILHSSLATISDQLKDKDSKYNLSADELDAIAQDLLKFLHDRFKVYLLDKGKRLDLIEAVLLPHQDDIYAISCRLSSLEEFLAKDDQAILPSLHRIHNILDDADNVNGNLPTVDRYTEKAEIALYLNLEKVKLELNELLQNNQYLLALELLSTLSVYIDSFFNDIFINDPVEEKRNNRIILLREILTTSGLIADFSKIAR